MHCWSEQNYWLFVRNIEHEIGIECDSVFCQVVHNFHPVLSQIDGQQNYRVANWEQVREWKSERAKGGDVAEAPIHDYFCLVFLVFEPNIRWPFAKCIMHHSPYCVSCSCEWPRCFSSFFRHFIFASAKHSKINSRFSIFFPSFSFLPKKKKKRIKILSWVSLVASSVLKEISFSRFILFAEAGIPNGLKHVFGLGVEIIARSSDNPTEMDRSSHITNVLLGFPSNRNRTRNPSRKSRLLNLPFCHLCRPKCSG